MYAIYSFYSLLKKKKINHNQSGSIQHQTFFSRWNEEEWGGKRFAISIVFFCVSVSVASRLYSFALICFSNGIFLIFSVWVFGLMDLTGELFFSDRSKEGKFLKCSTNVDYFNFSGPILNRWIRSASLNCLNSLVM